MPRSNRPRRGGRPQPRPGGPPSGGPAGTGGGLAGGARTERFGDADYLVRPVVGGGGGPYRCPGCEQEVGRGSPHMVAWPADDLWGEEAGLDRRRHWHTPCWAARGRRGPRR